MIFKTIRQSLEDVYIAGRKINELNNLKLNATNITAYATALKGLNAKQAELVLSTQGLTLAQKQAILSQAELLGSTGKLTTAELNAILVTKKRNKDQAEALLINTGLITSETAEATATNVVTAAKLKELVATGKLTQAEANLIAAKAGVTLANQKESASFLAGIGTKIKGAGTALKGLGTGILTIAQAHPVIAGITAALALCGGAALVNKVKQEKAAKAIKEAYEEAKNAINEINNTFSENSSKTKEIAKEYAELAQGINLLTNENKNLSTEKYERFLELSNQLSTLYPSLTKNFDENGVAILDLSGDVDTIVGSLDDLIEKQRVLANQEIMKQMPDLFAGYSNNIADLEEQKEDAKKTRDEIQRAYEVLNSWDGSTVWWSNGGQVAKGADNAIRSLSDYTNALDALGIKYKKVAVDLDNDPYHNNDGFSIEADYKQYGSELSDIYVSAFNKASDDVKYAEQQFEAETSSINQYLNTWLQTEFSYNQIEDSGLQKAIQDTLFNFDWSSLPEGIDKNDWEAVSEYLRRNILFSINNINDSDVSEALANIYSGSLNSGELLEAIAKVQEYFGSEHPISINLQAKVDDTQPLINNVKEKLQDDFDDKVGELTLEELHIAAEQVEVPEGTLLSLYELIANFKEVQSSTSNIENPISTFSDAWSQLQSSTDDATKELADNLTELAEQGRLTIEAFNEADSTDYFENLGISAEEAVKSINDLVSASTQLQSMSAQISKMSDMLAEKKKGNTAQASDLAGFDVEVRGLDSWEKFEAVMGSSKSTMEQCQKAANNLATEFVNSNNFLANLNETNKDYYVTALQNMGVENAKQFVEAQLAAKVLAHKLAVEELDFANKNSLSALQEKISGLLGEADAAGITTSALFDLIAQENIFANTSLNVGQKMTALQALAEAFGITADAALGATQAINLENQVRLVRHGEGTKAQEEAYAAQLTSKMQDAVHAKFGSISVSYKAPSSGGSKGGGSKGSSSKKEPQEIDWTANSIENLTTKIDLLNAKLEKSKSYKTQLKYLKQIRKETENLAKAYQKQADAYKKYWEKAASKISKSQKEMVMSGKTFSIKEYGEDTYKKLTDAQDAWKQYQEATIKAIETQQEAVEAKFAEYQRRVDYQQSRADKLEAQIAVTTSTQKKNDLENTRIKALKKQYEYEIKIAKAEGDTIKAKQLGLELEAEIIASKKTKFDNIVAQYENRANRKGYRIQDIENKVSLIEAKGSYVNADYYNRQYEEQKALAEMYDEEEKKLQTRLATIRKYSDEWYEALGTIQDIQDKENDALVTMEQLADKVNDVAKSLDDLLINKFSTMIGEAETLMALLGDNLVDDALGNFTDNGIAALGLIYSQMQAENEKGEQLRKQLEIIEAQKASYKDGETATFIDANGMKRTISSLKELKDLEDETRNSIQESSKAEYTYYKNIIDLMKERYEAERDYLDDLIEKKKALLEAEQDLHQYAKDIKEQTDSIASLQKQLAALSGDNSLEGQARRQKIEAQLKESKDTLAETEYDRLISDQETMLDNLASEYAEMLEGYMKDDESLFREGLAVVKENAALINEVTTSVADKWGMELSGEMESVVGNINLVDSTLNGIRSDLQDYFAATQGKKDGTSDTPASDTTFGGLSAGDLSSIITNIPHGSTVNHGGDSSTSTNREPDMMEGTGLKILNPVTIDPSTGKVIGTGQLVNIGSGKLVSLSSNDDDEIIRVDRGNGEIMELVKVETPPEWQNFGRSLLDSTVNTTPNFDAITRQIVDNAPTNVENTSNVSIENVSFSLPNVSNYRELMQEAQADPKFEGMIGHMIDTKLTGSNRLNKFRTKF